MAGLDPDLGAARPRGHARCVAIGQAQDDVLRLRGDQAALLPALSWRRYLEDLSEWPFQMSTVARWTLYLLIPPFTWVGAALIEIAVSAIVG